jgi:hypothetical protein
MHLWHGFWVFQLHQSCPQHARPDGKQQNAQSQRGCGLEPLVAIGVVCIRLFSTQMTDDQHHEV